MERRKRYIWVEGERQRMAEGKRIRGKEVEGREREKEMKGPEDDKKRQGRKER